jgi:hypothetical protein
MGFTHRRLERGRVIKEGHKIRHPICKRHDGEDGVNGDDEIDF